MQTFLAPSGELEEYHSIKNACGKGCRRGADIAGCMDSQKTHLIYGLSQGKKYRLILAANELKAREIYEDYRFFDPGVLYYPAKDLSLSRPRDVHGNLLVKERMQVIRALLSPGSLSPW